MAPAFTWCSACWGMIDLCWHVNNNACTAEQLANSGDILRSMRLSNIYSIEIPRFYDNTGTTDSVIGAKSNIYTTCIRVACITRKKSSWINSCSCIHEHAILRIVCCGTLSFVTCKMLSKPGVIISVFYSRMTVCTSRLVKRLTSHLIWTPSFGGKKWRPSVLRESNPKRLC